jgi:hypothetical protein
MCRYVLIDMKKGILEGNGFYFDGSCLNGKTPLLNILMV